MYLSPIWNNKAIFGVKRYLNGSIAITSDNAGVLLWSHEVDMFFSLRFTFLHQFLEKLLSLKYVHFQNLYFH